MNKLPIGHLFIEKFEILSLLGSGGMGVVYKARQVDLDRIVALKVLTLDLSSNSESKKRFELEAKLLSQPTNPHFCEFYQYGLLEDGVAYIAMEYIEGQSLKQLLLEMEVLDWHRAVRICRQICQAMADLHKLGIIHRDLKPENILVLSGDSDFVKIIDFGLGKFANKGANARDQLTQTGELLGTASYLSPELCKGFRADVRSDIYSLGCIFYELLTGKPPFQSENAVGLIYMHANQEFCPASKSGMADDAPGSIDYVLGNAMAKDPDLRYQTMTEFDNDLKLLETGHADLVKEVLPIQSSIGKGTRNSNHVLMLVVSCLAVLCLVMAALNKENFELMSARLSLSMQPNEENMLRWLEISATAEENGKSGLSEKIDEQILTAITTKKVDKISYELNFSKHELQKGRLSSASLWSKRALREITKLSRFNDEIHRQERIREYINQACSTLLESEQTFSKSDFELLMSLYQRHANLGVVSSDRLFSKIIEAVKPRATEDLIRVLEVDDKALAKEGNFSELERNFRFHKQFAEQFYGKNSPGVAKFLLHRAGCAKVAGNHQKARELFGQCMNILNNYTQHEAAIYRDALTDLCEWHYQNKDLVNAEKIANELIAINASRSDIQAMPYIKLATISFDRKQYTESVEAALRAREIAINRAPGDSALVEASSTIAARALLRQNHIDQAIEQIQNALTMTTPRSSDAIASRVRLLKQLSSIYNETGNFEQAARTADEALKLATENPTR